MTLLTYVLLVLVIIVTLALRLRPQVSPLLTMSLLFLVLLWYVVPVVLISGFYEVVVYLLIVPYSTFIAYAAVETFVLLFAVLFLFVPRPWFASITRSYAARWQLSPRIAALILLVSGLGTGGIFVFMRIAMGTSYVDRNAFVVTGEGSTAYNNLGMVVFFQAMLVTFGYAVLLTRWHSRRSRLFLHLTAATLIAFSTFSLLLDGSRLALLTPLILIALYAQARGWRLGRLLLVGGVLALVTIVGGGVMSIVIAGQRGQDALSPKEALTSSNRFVAEERKENITRRMVEQLAFKFDSFSTGAMLVRHFGAGSAGMRPLYGSLVSVVPRQFFTTKPVPGSVDGTYVGHPSRLVAIALGYDPYYATVGVSPAAVAIWQFGYILGPLILAVASIGYLYFINSFLLAESLVMRTLGLYMIGVPSFLGVLPTLDLLVTSIERVLVIFIAFAATLAVWRLIFKPSPRRTRVSARNA